MIDPTTSADDLEPLHCPLGHFQSLGGFPGSVLTPDAGATPGCSVEYFVGMLSGELRESVILPPSTCVFRMLRVL